MSKLSNLEYRSTQLPTSSLPGLNRLFLEFESGLRHGASSVASSWYAPAPTTAAGFTRPAQSASAEIIALLASQNPQHGAEESLARLRSGAGAVVTGQQVTLFGGPLFVPLKAATAVAHARTATAAGQQHVPVFWLASEDHDFAEVNHIAFPARRELRTLRYDHAPDVAVPVGRIVLDDSIHPLLDQAYELLGYSDTMDWLSAAYKPGRTLAEAFAEFYRNAFASHGLLVLDPAGREAHRLGIPVFAAAIERADELHTVLLERNQELIGAGFHAQVAVTDHSSLLFLIDSTTGARQALRRTPPSSAEPNGLWHAGRQTFSTNELLGILTEEPERISPSALLRPLFQDTILPTSAYIGGPAEIAYFAQSAVLYERILKRKTPVLPRLSATVIEPAIANIFARHEVDVEKLFTEKPDELMQRLAARAMPIEAKRLLSSTGTTLDTELAKLLSYMHSLDEGLGRSGETSARKMRYQMNRLRRLAANFSLQKEQSISRHVETIVQAILPHGVPQERAVGAAYFLARYGEPLLDSFINAAQDASQGSDSLAIGHRILWL